MNLLSPLHLAFELAIIGLYSMMLIDRPEPDDKFDELIRISMN
jgi:hypothetical protein